FFFQAEDGIRDFHVTGVQTCALPIFIVGIFYTNLPLYLYITHGITGLEAPKQWMLGLCLISLPVLFRQMTTWNALKSPTALWCRSEERRVGKECRARWWTDDKK